MLTQDFVLNGAGHGEVGQALTGARFDPGILRPYLTTVRDAYGNTRTVRAVTVNTGRTKRDNKTGRTVPVFKSVPVEVLRNQGIDAPVWNATSLRKEEWLEFDKVALRAARYRMRAWKELSDANTFGGFNAMAKLVLEHETMSDPGEAVVDLDGLSDAQRNDSPTYQLEGLPLPITHADFRLSQRRLAVSRNTGMPLDTTMLEASARRVGETIEKTTIGVQPGLAYGGNSTQVGGYGRTSQVYGYVNFPSRLTRSGLYRPTGVGRSGVKWVANDTLQDVLLCLDQLKLNKFFGPFMLYHSNDWDYSMDNDYILSGGNVATQTLRNRLKAIPDIMDVRRLDFLFASIPSLATGPGAENVTAAYPYTLAFVQMTPDVARAVNGLDVTTVQWLEKGGLELRFKVLAIQVPQLRADRYGNCGILHATATI